MLYLPDINILIYAKMAGTPEHANALAWLNEVQNDRTTTVLLCETTLLSFLRITTNTKVFSPSMPYAEAVSFISDLVERSNVVIYQPSAAHFVEVAKFMKKHSFGGSLTMDAHLAVVAMNTGAVLVTRDADFEKIPYLKTINPIGS